MLKQGTIVRRTDKRVQKFRSIEEMNNAPVPESTMPPFERFLQHCAQYWAIAPQASALYGLLGNRFGGTNPEFAVPDLRGDAPSQFNYYINLGGISPQRPSETCQ